MGPSKDIPGYKDPRGTRVNTGAIGATEAGVVNSMGIREVRPLLLKISPRIRYPQL